MKTIAILGTVGIPAAYGGFETLAENLARFHYDNELPSKLVVYCSVENSKDRPQSFLGAELRYISLSANGVSSILYDIVSLFSAVRRGCDVILLLGVSGALALPLVRLLMRGRIVTNIDGIEWQRDKWKWGARWFLRLSESIAVRFSDEVIADNAGIAEHVSKTYGRNCKIIAYGGDHAVKVKELPSPLPLECISAGYALALCRIEPENNVKLVLEAFADKNCMPLVFIGNWSNSGYGQVLKQRYSDIPHLYLLDPIYDLGILNSVRSKTLVYVHGHSAGGTNPSLVEMMHFGVPILAFDCTFNRYTTQGEAILFRDVESLRASLESLTPERSKYVGVEMKRIAQKLYTWDVIGEAYFAILLSL